MAGPLTTIINKSILLGRRGLTDKSVDTFTAPRDRGSNPRGRYQKKKKKKKKSILSGPLERRAAVSCSPFPYVLGGVGLVSGLTGKQGRAWVVHGMCMVVLVLVMLCGGWIGTIERALSSCVFNVL